MFYFIFCTQDPLPRVWFWAHLRDKLPYCRLDDDTEMEEPELVRTMRSVQFIGWSNNENENENGKRHSTETMENDENEDAAVTPSKLAAITLPRNGTCGICLLQPIDAILVPCFHAFTCRACTERLCDNRCPVCRVLVKNVQRFYCV